MPLRSSLLPAMSFVASSAPVAASRTVTVTAASSPGALSASATSCHVAPPTVPSQRWSRRSIVRGAVPAPRLVQGSVPGRIDGEDQPRVAEAHTHDPS